VKSPLDIKIAGYLDVKVHFTREEDDRLIQKKKEMEST